MITKNWNIWCIARGGWVGFYCFLTNNFQINFKYLQNIAILCFQFVKFPWKNITCQKPIKMVECSFFINNFCYIFSNANGIEKPGICWRKILTLFNSIKRRTFCNVKLNIMMKRWKCRMANILNGCAIFSTIWKQQEAKAEAFGSRRISENWLIVWINKIWKKLKEAS